MSVVSFCMKQHSCFFKCIDSWMCIWQYEIANRQVFFVAFTKKTKNVERVTQIDIIEERPFDEIWVSWKDFKSQPN